MEECHLDDISESAADLGGGKGTQAEAQTGMISASPHLGFSPKFILTLRTLMVCTQGWQAGGPLC